MIPKTVGYTEIVKAVEAGLNGDKETCRKFIERFVIKFPVESDLTYAFRHLLEGNKNPHGLHLDSSFEGEKEGFTRCLTCELAACENHGQCLKDKI